MGSDIIFDEVAIIFVLVPIKLGDIEIWFWSECSNKIPSIC